MIASLIALTVFIAVVIAYAWTQRQADNAGDIALTGSIEPFEDHWHEKNV